MKKPSTAEGQKRKVVLIQVDGLPRVDMERAMDLGQLPFLASLVKQGWKTSTFYPGLPSATPAVQAELIYGVRCAVPAFAFYDRTRKRIHRMFDAESARLIEEQLEQNHEPILKGGVSCSNVYRGQAEHAEYTACEMQVEQAAVQLNPIRMVLTLFKHPVRFVNVTLSMLFELGLAVKDAAKGMISLQEIRHELKFINTRVGVCILLREIVETQIIEGMKDGLPVIHGNFLGFDEQAHRRGPSSRFARWTLKGIDRVINRIHQHNEQREEGAYDIIIFSDHGQEDVIPYRKEFGEDVATEIQRSLCRVMNKPRLDPSRTNPGDRGLNKLWDTVREQAVDLFGDDESFVVTAQGPIGHVYSMDRISAELRKLGAKALAADTHIPQVFYLDEDDRLFKAYPDGTVQPVAEVADEILGRDHPHQERVIEDLIALSRSEFAGDWVISSWRANRAPVSFATEHGAHGGIGSRETTGFVLLSPETDQRIGKDTLRGEDLYHDILDRQANARS